MRCFVSSLNRDFSLGVSVSVSKNFVLEESNSIGIEKFGPGKSHGIGIEKRES